MNTQLYTINSPESAQAAVMRAGAVIKAGGLVAMPTETVYGLGANAFDEEAVRRIFSVKGRPADNPLIVHISDLDMWEPLVREVTAQAKALANSFWPGPLSIILPHGSIIPQVTRGGLDTVAVRMPANDIARAIIKEAGVPVAAPSANISGSPSPTTAQHCIDDLWGRVDVIVDAGPCGVGLESTVISLAGKVPVVLRPGAVTTAQLRGVLGEVFVHPSVDGASLKDERPQSPGMKYRHYSPKARVVLIDAETAAFAEYVNAHMGENDYALCFDEDAPLLKGAHLRYGSRMNSAAQARLLFGRLRELDRLGARVVYAHCPGREGVGAAVYNRIYRAAGSSVITL